MKLYYIFSKNDKIGSKIISYFSGLLVKDLYKVPSHVGLLIEFSDSKQKFVIESVVSSGVRLVPYKSWLKINEECYVIQTQNLQTSEVFSTLVEVWNKKYDWFGLIYFSLNFLAHVLFKTPFSKTNKWSSSKRFFCTELVGKLEGYNKHSMTTPAKMCLDFLNEEM